MASPLIIAHRGASAEAPENTLAAFRRALALRVDGIELDVQVTRDGVPVVFHDFTLRRLTGQPGRLSHRTWHELKRLKVSGSAPIPRLRDVLALTRGHTVVQIELKYGTAVAPVVRTILHAKAAGWVILASFDPKLVRTAGRISPKIPRMLISAGRGSAERLLRQMASLRACGLSLDFRSVRSRAFVRKIQSGGAVVWCWTVNRPADLRRMITRGVNGVLTDNPALLQREI